MARGLKIHRFGVKRPNFWGQRCVRTRLVVVEAFGDIQRSVFVFERQPANPTTGLIDDIFQGVASPVDLEILQVDNPADGTQFFLSDRIELDLRAPSEFQEFLEVLEADVCGLIDALELTDEMSLDDILECGDETPTPSASVSDSVSESV